MVAVLTVFNKLPLMFAALVPVIPPLNPAPVGGDQLKVVPNGMAPFVPSVGVKINAMPPQVTVDI